MVGTGLLFFGGNHSPLLLPGSSWVSAVSSWLLGAALDSLVLTSWATFGYLSPHYWMQEYTLAHFNTENPLVGTLPSVNE